MKKAISNFLTVLLVLLGIQLNAATITSNSTGGDWSSSSTWVGGVVPGSLDDVVINGTVTLDGNYSCNNITIASTATLVNENNWSRSLTVNVEMINSGIVKSDVTASTLSLYLKGDLQNYGDYEVDITYMDNGTSHKITLSSGKWLKGNWYFGANDIVDFQSDIRFKEAYIDGVIGTSKTQFKTNNYRFDTYKITLREMEVLSAGNIKLDSSVVEYFTLTGNATTEGYTSIGYNVSYNGEITNNGTLANEYNWSRTLVSSGKLTNYGNVISDATSSTFTIDLYGDLDNQNIYSPTNTYINGNAQLSCKEDKYLEGKWYLDGTDSLTLTSDLLFTQAEINGTKNSSEITTVVTNGYTFNTLNMLLQRLKFKGSDTLNLDSSVIRYAVVEGDAISTGYTSIGYDVSFSGDITNNGTLANEYNWSRTLIINGKLTNDGNVISDASPSTFTIDLYGDIDNRNIYSPNYTYINGNAQLSCEEDKHLKGKWYLDGTDSITLRSDLLFTQAEINGTKNSSEISTVVTNGYAFNTLNML
ncbi:MAG: hypothetical protein KJP21_09435, partial [Bacteroidia bacterium]|nr:hypothetical protein [Bacteroidia bacterium]